MTDLDISIILKRTISRVTRLMNDPRQFEKGTYMDIIIVRLTIHARVD